jgi:hypothetical protein
MNRNIPMIARTTRSFIASRPVRLLTALTLCMTNAIATAAPAKAAAAFDGQWSVLIVTEKGDCDRGYRYPLQISKGSVGYAGQASFNVSGRVNESGAITVTVSRGEQSARGTGQLAGNRGSGAWKTGGGECSGTWTAERRS